MAAMKNWMIFALTGIAIYFLPDGTAYVCLLGINEMITRSDAVGLKKLSYFLNSPFFLKASIACRLVGFFLLALSVISLFNKRREK
jgi:hypothetical protein